MNTNKRYYFLYSITKKSLLIWTVFLLFLVNKGLTYTEALLLDSIAAFTTMIFEIPSGILADRTNRKNLTVAGEILITINYLLLLLSNSYVMLIVGALCNGLGDACISGSTEALMYESIGNKEEYLKYTSGVSKWGLRITAISTLFASFLFNINMYLPLIISIIAQIGIVYTAYNLKEKSNRKINYEKKEKNLIRKEFKIQVKNIKFIICNKHIIRIFLLYIAMIEIISNINYTSQIFLPDNGIPVKYMGIAFAIFSIISSYGAKYASKIKINGKIIILLYGFLLVGLSYSNIVFIVLILAVSRFINGMIWPIISAEINSKLNDDNRATIMSYQSLLAQIAPLLLDPLLGVIMDIYGLRRTYLVMGVSIFMALLILVTMKKNYIKAVDMVNEYNLEREKEKIIFYQSEVLKRRNFY